MTVVDTPARTAEDVLRAVQDLTPTITARAAEIEAARRVPADLLADLIGTGCFRMLLPSSHGGAASDLATAMRTLETLAVADASVAWTVGIGAGAWLDLVGLPRATFDDIVGTSPDVIGAGVFQPAGTAVPAEGGYRVTGRWSFASGCEHATWIYGNCIVPGDGAEEDAPPRCASLCSPPARSPSRTRGTSWACAARVATISASTTCSYRSSAPSMPWGIRRASTSPSSEPRCSPCWRCRWRASPSALPAARSTTSWHWPPTRCRCWRSARCPPTRCSSTSWRRRRSNCGPLDAVVYDQAETIWAAAASGAESTMHDQALARAAGAWATSRCAAIVDMAYRSGGGSSLYSDHPLQRRLRDVHAITQHFLVKADTLTAAGAVLAGHDPGVPLF